MSIRGRIEKFRSCVKRAFDVAVSGFLLIVLSPLFLIIAIAIVADSGLPVFFVQARPGYKGKPFRMYKFRTMKDLRDKDGNLLPDELRITPCLLYTSCYPSRSEAFGSRAWRQSVLFHPHFYRQR